MEQWLETRPRLNVSGCDKDILVPPRVLDLNTPYTSGRVYGCQRARRYIYNVQALREGINEFIELADRTSRSNSTNGDATCLANTIYTWASRDALTTIASSAVEDELRQAQVARAWYVSALASNYARIKSIREAASRMGKKQIIEDWFEKVGNLTTLAAVTRRTDFVKEGRRIYDLAINEIRSGPDLPTDDKGFLPLELNRKYKAQSYHRFALLPILGMYNFSKAMGCDYVKSEDDLWKIAALIRKTNEGYYYRSVFQDATGGAQQNAVGHVEGLMPLLSDASEREFILKIVRDYSRRRDIPFNLNRAPEVSSALGGNTALFTAPDTIKFGINSAFRIACRR